MLLLGSGPIGDDDLWYKGELVTGRGSEPAWRALEPAGRALGPARRALDPAGRPGAIWEGQLRGRRGGRRKEKEKKIEITERYQYVLVP